MFETAELGRETSKEEYKKQEPVLRTGLLTLQYELREADFPLILLIAGSDRLGCADLMNLLHEWMDARYLEANVFEAPTDEERERPRFWRYWRALPASGRVRIFHREWTTRAIVDRLKGNLDDAGLDERLEGFATEDDWQRAYSEINDFEEMLVHHGILLLKFWMHISPEEQLRRFKAREKVPFKKYKITAEDYRNRDRWNAYELAADEMVQRTSTDYARWHLVAGNDKRWARIQVLKTVCRELEAALD